MTNKLQIGLVSISDRASSGEYEDQGIPALKDWLQKAILSPYQLKARLIADEQKTIEKTLIELSNQGCDLILTTGGTGPSRRDVTPEATRAVAKKELPGIAEQMRQISLNFVPTAVLSRQVAAIRETENHATLILNLPGRPQAICQTLEGLRDKDGKLQVSGIFTVIPYCIELIGGPSIQTNEAVSKAWRPKQS